MKSPQILELSGIGDPEILSKIGIETKVSLPAVGTNVQDHASAGISYGTLYTVKHLMVHAHSPLSIELKEPEKYNTVEALTDPAQAAEQLKL